MAKKKKNKRNKKSVKKILRVHFLLTTAAVFLYLSVGFFAGWGILFSDIQHKGKVAGASVAAVVSVLAPPSKPAVTATASCTTQHVSHVELGWGLDANATTYDVYRNSAVLMLGVTENSFDDQNVAGSSAYEYYVVAKGPSGSATSDPVTATAASCSTTTNPEVTVETFQNKSISSLGRVPGTIHRKPVFQGQTNIPNAIIEIEVHSSDVVYATTSANSNGYWQWSTPSKLSYRSHTLFVRAIDPFDSSVVANTSFDFKIEKKDEKKDNDKSKAMSSGGDYYPSNNSSSSLAVENTVEQTELQTEAQTENKKPLDFKMEIENKSYVKGVSMSEEAYRGENLEVKISFTEMTKENQEINLQYTLSSLDQKVLAEYNDNVKINSGKEIIKEIPLSYNLEPGKYKIQISAIVLGATVSHENYFVLKDRPALKTAAGSVSYVDLASNLGWLTITCFSILIILFLGALWEHDAIQKFIDEKIIRKRNFSK